MRYQLQLRKHKNPSILGHTLTCTHTQSHTFSYEKKLITIILSLTKGGHADKEVLCPPFADPYNQACIHSYQPLYVCVCVCLPSWLTCI